MARTTEGATLTTRHRQAQLAIRTQTLRDFTRLWPMWGGDRESFGRLVAVTVPLVQLRRRQSAGQSSSYYRAYRMVEGEAGDVPIRLAAQVDTDKVVTSLYVTGARQVQRSVQAGFSAQAARQTALTTMSGAVTRHVLDGGRATILDTIREDNRAAGWERVTDGDPCAFCALIASRGAVYESEGSGGFQAHDHCACTAEPRMLGDDRVSERNRRFADIYDKSVTGDNAVSSGTSNDALNDFRRLYESSR